MLIVSCGPDKAQKGLKTHVIGIIFFGEGGSRERMGWLDMRDLPTSPAKIRTHTMGPRRPQDMSWLACAAEAPLGVQAFAPLADSLHGTLVDVCGRKRHRAVPVVGAGGGKTE